MDRRALVALPLVAGLAAGLSYGLGALAPSPALSPAPWPETAPPEAPPVAPPDRPVTRAPSTEGARWIAAGGGALPSENQVQIEQDLALAAETLDAFGPGVLLYAGGAGSEAVQVLRPEPPPRDLRARLGALFDPRPGRDSAYRRTELSPVGAASREAILEALRGALGDSDTAPLTVYLAGHGLGGDAPIESRLLTWGPGDLWVADVADALDEAGDHRPVRLVVTSCYGGGFAEIAFHRGDPDEGEARSDRCGFFATTWDRVAAGCDPDPDRGSQEGYGLHFLHALRGEDRDGVADPSIDVDGDGVVSLLEAHTRARIASRSLDVPVTTSERFLRAAALDDDELDPEAADRDAPSAAAGPTPRLPEEDATVAALSADLGLPTAEAAEAEALRLDTALREDGEALDALDLALADAQEALHGELLHRWPTLDDPWHPDFEATLAASGDAIATHLADSASAAQLEELEARRAEVADAHDARLLALARVERLVRAHETIALARRLAAEGGRPWLRYQSFLACERGAP